MLSSTRLPIPCTGAWLLRGNFGLYSVDIAKATATKLYDLENQEQICGMYLPEPEYAAAVPAMISSVSPSFSGVNLSGTVNFSMPRYAVGQGVLPMT